MSDISFTYGTYRFRPAPVFSVQTEYLKTPDGVGYGQLHTLSCQGHLILTGQDLSLGITGLFNDEYYMKGLKQALDADGKLLLIYCGEEATSGNTIISGFPTIESFNIENKSDNFTRRADFTLDFKLPGFTGVSGDAFNDCTFPPFIQDVSESWDVEVRDEQFGVKYEDQEFPVALNVTHSLDVTARLVYTGVKETNDLFEDAKKYATGIFNSGTFGGLEEGQIRMSGLLNAPSGEAYNQIRQISCNKTEGTVNIVENFVFMGTGSLGAGAGAMPRGAIENFDLNLTVAENITTVNVQGEIQGLASIDYQQPDAIQKPSTSAWDAAEAYFNAIEPTLIARASGVYGMSGVSGCGTIADLNSAPITRTIGCNPKAGTISYDYQFDNKSKYCITGDCIISQNISIDDQLATDVFASHVALGRQLGPVLQDIGTTTAQVRTLSIELVIAPATGCSGFDPNGGGIYANVPRLQIDGIINNVVEDLSTRFDIIYTGTNTENWNFTQGRYTRSVAWTYNKCRLA